MDGTIDFRRFFVLKTFVFFTLILEGNILGWQGILLLISSIIACFKKRYILGLFIIFLASLYILINDLPYTINHKFLETFILLQLLILNTDFKNAKISEEKLNLELIKIIKYSLLSVWFFSGVQKLVHGYYLNGEIFVFLSTYSNSFFNEIIFDFFSFKLYTVIPPNNLDFFYAKDIVIPNYINISLVTLGCLVIFSEIFFSLLALYKEKYIIFLLGLQILILMFSGEWDFTFTNLICISLIYNKNSSLYIRIITLFYIIILLYYFTISQ